MEAAVPSPSRNYHRPGAVSDAVDEQTIRAVVHDFYGRVRADDQLGPVFGAYISDWTPHLEKMVGFWMTVVRGERRYQGNPFEAHQKVTELSSDLFAHWLNLFGETLRDHCSAEDAQAWEATARRMGFAMSWRLGLGENEALLP